MEGVIFDTTPHPAHVKSHRWDRSRLLECVSKLRTTIISLNDVCDEIKNIKFRKCVVLHRILAYLKEKGKLMRSPCCLCVCLSVGAPISTFRPIGWLSWNVVWTLCHWRPPQLRTFYFHTVGSNSMTNARICEVGDTEFRILKLCMVIGLRKNMKLLLRQFL
jgi:hypothetical protein